MSRILIVDDSQAMRLLVKELLVNGGHEVIEAVDGQDGLELLERDAQVKLVVLDINMPRMNGLELLKHLKTSGRIDAGLPVLMLTTEGQAEQVRAARAAGAKGWIVKPFKPELFMAAVDKFAA